MAEPMPSGTSRSMPDLAASAPRWEFSQEFLRDFQDASSPGESFGSPPMAATVAASSDAPTSSAGAAERRVDLPRAAPTQTGRQGLEAPLADVHVDLDLSVGSGAVSGPGADVDVNVELSPALDLNLELSAGLDLNLDLAPDVDLHLDRPPGLRRDQTEATGERDSSCRCCSSWRALRQGVHCRRAAHGPAGRPPGDGIASAGGSTEASDRARSSGTTSAGRAASRAGTRHRGRAEGGADDRRGVACGSGAAQPRGLADGRCSGRRAFRCPARRSLRDLACRKGAPHAGVDMRR